MGQMTDAQKKECSGQSEVAEKIMEGRQAGVPMRKMIDLAEGDQLLELMVKWAYDEPGYSSDQMQRRSATKFGNRQYRLCLDASEDS